MIKMPKFILLSTFIIFLSTTTTAMVINTPLETFTGSQLIFGCGQNYHDCGIGHKGHPDFYTIDGNPEASPDLVFKFSSARTIKTTLLKYLTKHKANQFDLIVFEYFTLQECPELFDTLFENLHQLLTPTGKIIFGIRKHGPFACEIAKQNMTDEQLLENIPMCHYVTWDANNSLHRQAFQLYAASLSLKLRITRNTNLNNLKIAFTLSHCFKQPLDADLIEFTKHFSSHETAEAYATCHHCAQQNFMGKTVYEVFENTKIHGHCQDDCYSMKIPAMYRILGDHKVQLELVSYLPLYETRQFATSYLCTKQQCFDNLKEKFRKLGYTQFAYAFNPTLPVPDEYKCTIPDQLEGVNYDYSFMVGK